MSSLGELAMASRYRRPTHRRMLSLTVRSSEQISPSFMSVTLGGEDVGDLEESGFDQNGRLFFAQPEQQIVAFPGTEKWMMHYARTPSAKRPRVRFYSVRRHRPEQREIDIEVVLHGAAGGESASPGSTWARNALPGTQVRFLDEGRVYVPPREAMWQLLVGDESALPPILAILEQSSLPAEAFVEVPTVDDIRTEVVAPEGSAIHWLPRDDPSRRPGTLALEAVKAATLRPGRYYTWTAGESALPTGLRRHLVNERRVAKSDIAFLGYWRLGRASLG